MSELKEAVENYTGKPLSTKRLRKATVNLIEQDKLGEFRAGNATEYTAQVASNLAEVLELAKTAVRPDEKGSAGRRTTATGSRAVEFISGKQLERITTVCNDLASYLQPDVNTRDHAARNAVLQQVGMQYFAWDPHAGVGGRGEWKPFIDLVAEATKQSSLREQRQKVGAAKTLLDLAATHGWIGKTERHVATYQALPIEWTEVFNDWHSLVLEHGNKSFSIKRGLLAIFDACSSLGMDPREADWRRVQEYLEASFRATNMRSDRRTEIRSMYRVLRSLGVIKGPNWDGHAAQREGALILLPRRAIQAIADLYGADGEQEGVRDALMGECTRWPGWEGCSGLVEGPYGLRRAVLHFTVKSSLAEELGLPARGAFPNEAIRAVGARSLVAWSSATVVINIRPVLWYAGWLKKYRGVDFSRPENDLRALLDEDNLKAWRSAWLAGRIGNSSGGLRSWYARALKTLSRLASPFAEAVAMERGEDKLMESMARVSAMLNSPKTIDGRKSWLSQLKADSYATAVETARSKARRIQQVWTRDRTICDFAYEQLEKIGEELIRQIEEGTGMALSEQVAAISEGTWMPPRRWARRVLEALYWQDQLIVPLRSSTSEKLDLADRIHSSDFMHIRAEIDRVKMKSRKPFAPNYAMEKDSPYNRTLYQLYVMPGGAREILRTDSRGVLRDVPAFYVHDVRRTDSERLNNHGFSRLVERSIKACEHVLGGVTLEELKAAKVLGTHFFRHAFGTIMVHNGLTELAAHYLHHSDLKMLKEVYSANGAEDYDSGSMLRRARQVHGATDT